MTRDLELTGQVFGWLRVEARAYSNRGRSTWLCVCSCGNRTTILGTSLVRGLSRSCGCKQHEKKNRLCTQPDCGQKHASKGLCAQHYMQANARELKNKYLLRRYGITLETYEAKIAEQGGVCAVSACKRAETDRTKTGKVRMLAVDHVPGTRTVRALLCRRCNTLLGQVGESTALLRALAAYLEAHPRKQGGSHVV
jgi:hypothetical protein